jgi:DNA-binding beta-propeller fold protein YncE
METYNFSLKSVIVLVFMTFPNGIVIGQEKFKAPKLSYHPVENFFHLPPNMNFGEVSAVALSLQGNIFVFNRGSQPIFEFSKDGKFVRTLAEELVGSAHGLRIDEHNNLWITDVVTHTVLRLNQEGNVTLVLGRKNRSGETDALFNQPTDVAFGPAGEIFVTDGYGNSRVVKFDRDGNFMKAWGRKGNAPGEFNLPHTIVIDKKNLVYVGDRENNRIQIFDLDGNFLKEWRHVGAPWGLGLAKDGTIFMADGYANRVLQLDSNGKILGTFGESGRKPGQLMFAHSVTVATDGSLFVSEILNWRVQKFFHD